MSSAQAAIDLSMRRRKFGIEILALQGRILIPNFLVFFGPGALPQTPAKKKTLKQKRETKPAKQQQPVKKKSEKKRKRTFHICLPLKTSAIVLRIVLPSAGRDNLLLPGGVRIGKTWPKPPDNRRIWRSHRGRDRADRVSRNSEDPGRATASSSKTI